MAHSGTRVGGLVVLLGATVVLAGGCAPPPRARPLAGRPVAVAVPRTALPAGHARLVFRWEYRDRFFSARGEGVARIAPPDSVRFDFFADGNLGGGSAILIGDSLFTPASGDAQRYLPPIPLLWAALGRLVPAASDTVLRLDADTLRVELAGDARWRAAFVETQLVSLTRIEGDRLREDVHRIGSNIVYRHHGARRRLALSITRRMEDPPFDAAIWRR